MRIRTVLLLPLLLAAGTACTPIAAPPVAPPGPDALAQVGRWSLQGATNAAGQPIAVAGLLRGTSEWRIAESYPEQLFLQHADGRRSHWVAVRQTL